MPGPEFLCADPNKTTRTGRTSLGTAACIGNTNILKTLLDSVKNKTVSGHFKQVQNKKRVKGDIHSPSECQMKFNKSLPYMSVKNHRHSLKYGCQIDDRKCDRDDINCDLYDVSKHLGHNRGYFIVTHKESLEEPSSSTVNEHMQNKMCTCSSTTSSSNSSTPTNLEGPHELEWDEELKEEQPIVLTYEDEHWTSLYKWYASILEKTGSVLSNAPKEITGPNQQDTFHRTAVHYAAEQGDKEALKMLIDAGCNPDVYSSDGLTPLHLAVAKDHVRVVEVLIKSGAYINRTTADKNTALHIAASRGCTDMVNLLCKYNISLEARDLVERTALMVAVSRRNNLSAAILIAAGANVNTEEINGYTPLCEAVWQYNAELVGLLIKAGARLTYSHHLIHYAVVHSQIKMVHLLSKAGGVDLHNDNGDTPLIVAVKVMHLPIANILLKHGAKVNKCNRLTGASVIHQLVESQAGILLIEQFLKCFLDYGANLNIISLGGDTPLNRSTLLHRDGVTSLLIKHGADVNICDLKSCVADNLSMVSRRHNLPLTRLFLAAGHVAPTPPDLLKARYTNSVFNNYRLAHEPMTLMQCCRITIRRALKAPIYRSPEYLFLPETLHKFLMFEELNAI